MAETKSETRWYELLRADLGDIKTEVGTIREQVNCSRVEQAKEIGEAKVSIQEVRTELQETKLELTKSIDDVKAEVSSLRVRAGLWGTIGASIPAAIIILSQFAGWFK